MNNESRKLQDIRKTALKKDPTILDKYLATLPDMVEEKVTTRNLSGEQIIKEYLEAGNKTEAEKYKPDVRYNLNTVQLVKMDHRINATNAFITNGQKGLENYRKKVFEIGYYIKGKYPQYVRKVRNGNGLWSKLIKSISSLFNKQKNESNKGDSL